MNALADTKAPSRLPLWVRILALLGVVWYAFGLLQFWMAYTMDTAQSVSAANITAAHGAAIDDTPTGIWIAFAITSAAGLVGSALLFADHSLSKMAFAISLASALIYYLWVYQISGTGGDRPDIEAIIAFVVCSVTFVLYWISRRAT